MRHFNLISPEARERLVRRGVRKFRRHAPALDRMVRAARAALELRYLRGQQELPIVVDIGRFPYMGFGASIGWLHAAYVARELLSVPLYIVNPDRWPFGGRDSRCSLGQFIEFPESQVLMQTQLPPKFLPFEVGHWDNLRRWGYFDDLEWPNCLFGRKPHEYPELEDFRRAVFAKTYQPTRYTHQQVEGMLGFLPQRYMAWHVRRGDKTSGRWQEDAPVPVEDYARATALIYEQQPDAPRRVVVCTDSDKVIAQARDAMRTIPGGAEIVHDPREKRWDGYCALQRSGKITDIDVMVEEVLTSQKVIEILRGAHTLIGCNSSCLFRVASLLRPDGSAVISLSENKAWKKYFPI
jgi:hypothetical protein